MGNKESKVIKHRDLNYDNIKAELKKHLPHLQNLENTCKQIVSDVGGFVNNSSIQIIVSGKLLLTMKSGNGSHTIILVGDNYGLQRTSFEITIRTSIITGVFLSCPDNFKMIVPELYNLDESLEESLGIAKEFVQTHMFVTSWDNAKILIKNPMSIQIVAGEGKHHFTIEEMKRLLNEESKETMSKIYEKKQKYERLIQSYNERQARNKDIGDKSLQPLNFDLILDDTILKMCVQVKAVNKILLGKLKVMLCGNEGFDNEEVDTKTKGDRIKVDKSGGDQIDMNTKGGDDKVDINSKDGDDKVDKNTKGGGQKVDMSTKSSSDGVDEITRYGESATAKDDPHRKLSSIFHNLIDECQKNPKHYWNNMLITIYLDDVILLLQAGKGQHKMTVLENQEVFYE